MNIMLGMIIFITNILCGMQRSSSPDSFTLDTSAGSSTSTVPSSDSARITPTSPMDQYFLKGRSSSPRVDTVLYDIGSGSVIRRFLTALDGDKGDQIRAAPPTLLKGTFDNSNVGREPAVIRAVRKHCVNSFIALLDCGVDLMVHDTALCTLAMHIALCNDKIKQALRTILTDRKITLSNDIPTDKYGRNALWYAIEHGAKMWEEKEYADLVRKVTILKECGVSADAKDVKGVSAIDLATTKYGCESNVVQALRG